MQELGGLGARLRFHGLPRSAEHGLHRALPFQLHGDAAPGRGFLDSYRHERRWAAAFLAALPQWERDYLLDAIKARNAAPVAKTKAALERGLPRSTRKRELLLLDRRMAARCQAPWAHPLVTPDGGIVAFIAAGRRSPSSARCWKGEIGPKLVNLVREVKNRLQRVG